MDVMQDVLIAHAKTRYIKLFVIKNNGSNFIFYCIYKRKKG